MDSSVSVPRDVQRSPRQCHERIEGVMKIRLRTLFAFTLIAAIGSLMIRNRREIYVWSLHKVPAIRLLSPAAATSAWGSSLEEASLRSEEEAVTLLNTMLKGPPMEQDFALKHLQDSNPTVVAHHAEELVDILADFRYRWLSDAACDQLIRVGPHARPQVSRLLELAKDCEEPWQQFRVEYVLTAIGDFRPEVVSVINDIRGERTYQMIHPNTNLHPGTGVHYIDSIHLSDRLRAPDSDGEPSVATKPPS